MMVNWGLSETLCYLRHLERLGEAERVRRRRRDLVVGGGAGSERRARSRC